MLNSATLKRYQKYECARYSEIATSVQRRTMTVSMYVFSIYIWGGGGRGVGREKGEIVTSASLFFQVFMAIEYPIESIATNTLARMQQETGKGGSLYSKHVIKVTNENKDLHHKKRTTSYQNQIFG